MKERLNKYFKRSEFACKCGCGFNAVDVELLEMVTDVREHFGSPVIINSGCRCSKYNKTKAVGGAPKSKHLRAIATDIKVVGVTPRRVYNYLCKKYPRSYGFGLHSTFVHADIRKRKWREIYK